MANNKLQKLQSSILGEKFTERFRGQMLHATEAQVQRMQNIFVTEVAKNSRIANCSAESVLIALLRCARLDLEPGEGLCALVPFGNECNFQVEYRGMLVLMQRTGKLKDLCCEVVYDNDEFTYYTDVQQETGYVLHHRRAFGDRGKLMAVYCVLRLVNGGHYHVVMGKEEVLNIRNNIKGTDWSNPPKTSPWVRYEDAMWRKTAIKQASKVCPISYEVASADRIDDLDQVGKEQPPPVGISREEIIEIVAGTDDDVIAKASEAVEVAQEAIDESPIVEETKTRKRSSKLVAKDAYLEAAMAVGMGEKAAISAATNYSKRDDARTMNEEDWALNSERIKGLAGSPPPLSERTTPKDVFIKNGPPPFKPPSGQEQVSDEPQGSREEPADEELAFPI